jgi:hypothetical protein
MQVYGLQWDSAAGDFPPRARLKALYVNGAFATRPVKYRRGLIWIDVTGADPAGAYWLDVERGDATPAQVPGWLDARKNHVGDYGSAGIYCNRSTLPAVQEAAGDRPHALWVATLDGTASVTLPDAHGRLVAIQDYPASMVGLDADISIVVDQAYWTAHALP